MIALLVALLLGAGANPTAADARSLCAAKSWDEAYLRFASVKPDGYSGADKKAIGKCLLAAAHALADEDKGLAFSAADLAARFEPRAQTLIFAAELAQATGNNGQAAEALDKALAIEGKNARALLARADLAMAESDHSLALKFYERVPKGPESAKARSGAKAAREAIAQRKEAKGEVRKIEEDLAHPKPVASEGPVAVAPGQPLGVEAGALPGESRSLGLDGMRVRESPYFHFIYSGSGKDFNVRSEYEGKVMEALEEARTFVAKEWGQARETPVDVVLYTKEEYELHFGGSSLGRALGFYSGKIRVSNAAEITPAIRSVIVHEYTHAVVDDLIKSHPVPHWLQEGTATVVEMQYGGRMDGSSPDDVKVRLRVLAHSKRLPMLENLDHSFMEMGDTRTAYHYSAAAVRELISKNGISGYIDFLQEIGRGKPFAAAFTEHYFPALSDLDELLHEQLARP